MQLYSIEYDQLTRISTFDDKGQKTGDREERVRVSMHNLPLQTAQMYRGKMTGLNFVMTMQVASQDEPRVRRRDRDSYESKRQPRQQAASPAQPTAAEKRNKAAASGDMTAAINLKGKP